MKLSLQLQIFPSERVRLRALAAAAVALLIAAHATASPVISEFMAQNTKTLADEDGSYSDWVEIYNPDATAVDLGGWALTDNASKKQKWLFPSGTVIAANGYLVVFADDKDRTDPTKTLHTSFSLSAGGEYLGLVGPDGTTVVSEFAPTFPAQQPDVSYGVTQPPAGTTPLTGFLAKATPGKANGDNSAIILADAVTFSQSPGLFNAPLSVTLTGATGDNVIRYVTAAPSSSGTTVAAPTSASTAYTGPITVSSSVIIRAAVFSADGARHGRYSTSQYVHVGSAATFESDLPVFVLDNHGLGDLDPEGSKKQAWLHIAKPGAAGRTRLANGSNVSTPITEKIRGSSSALFPKKSYNISLLDTDGNDAPASLLQMNPATNWALVGPWFYDRSYIRNAYIYTLSNRIGRWAPRTEFVEMFFNGNGGDLDTSDYAGISVLTERIEIDPNRVAIPALKSTDNAAPTVTGGYILKFDTPEDDDYFFVTTRGIPIGGDTVINVDSPESKKLTTAQQQYIQGYVQEMEDAMVGDSQVNWATRRYLDYLDRDTWIDHHLLNVLSGNVDALRKSEYMFKDRNGKMIAGPVWDFDRSMGSYDGRDAAFNVWTSNDALSPWTLGWWGILAKDPDFMQAWVDRWQQLRSTAFSQGSLDAFADSLASQVGTEAAARDATRWADNASTYGPNFLAEVDHLKTWVRGRAEWIDTFFLVPPQASAEGESFIITPAAGAQLAYTFDGSDPRLSGGGLSPTAIVTDQPITISKAQVFTARSYDRSRSYGLPGSPWSGVYEQGAKIVFAAGDKEVIPDRFQNLSTRGTFVEGGGSLIAGVAVRGTGPKLLLIRGVGPTLSQFGVSNALPHPRIRIVGSDGDLVGENTGWNNSQEVLDATGTAGAFPLAANSEDAAMLVLLNPGNYTVELSSASQSSGDGLIEIYEVDQVGRAINLSTRASIAPNGSIFGGLVIQGLTPKKVLIRAIGPTLSQYGVASPMTDPTLAVYSGDQIIATNDNWTDNGAEADLTGATSSAGAFALKSSSLDSATVVELKPGAYTVRVADKNGSPGDVLLEFYELP